MATDGEQHSPTGRFEDLAAAMRDVLELDLDVVDAMDRVVDACVRFTSAVEAGVVLADGDRELHVIASTSERTSDVEEAQLGTRDGAALDCFWTAATIDVPDVSTRAGTWPTFTRTMRERGLAGVFAVPILLRADAVGSLCLFAGDTTGHDDRDAVLTQLLAGAASAALVRQRIVGQVQNLDEQVAGALEARITIEQAKGALSHRRSIGIDAAFQAMRTVARGGRRSLQRVAEDVVHHGADLRYASA